MRLFVDTNILLYAHDAGAGNKRIIAAALLRQLLQDGTGVVSSQVLIEFYVNATRKLAPPLQVSVATRIVETYAAWVVSSTSGQTVVQALHLRDQHNLSPWDALIVSGAIEAGCEVLYSEDMQHGLRLGNLEIRNPFHTS